MPQDGFIRKDSAGAADRPSEVTAVAPNPDGAKSGGALEGTREGMIQTSPEGQILTANAALAQILGYEPADELIRAVPNIRNLYVEGTKRAELERQLLDHGAVVNCEVQFRRKNGSLVWTASDIHVVRTAQGVTCYEGKMLDITDRKRAEEAVREVAGRAGRQRRVTVTVELAILGGLTVLVYGLSAHFDWFEAATNWFLAHSGAQQLNDFVVAVIFFVAGLSVFAFRRWRESESKVVSSQVAQEAARLLHAELDIRVAQRTAELSTANEALRVSERMFQAVFEQASVGVLIAEGPRGRYVSVNRRFCEMVGYTAEELRQLTSEDITHPDDVSADAAKLEQINAGTIREFNREKRYRKKDGAIVWVRARAFMAPLDPTEARPTLRIGIIEDITERKRAEESMRQSEERYRLLFENNPLPMWLYDLETLRFLAVNEAAVHHYGYTREEFLGMTIKDIRPAEDIPALVRSAEQGRTEGASSSEWNHRRKDGTIIRVEVISRPLEFAGRAARLVLASDITEKKLLEEKFLHAQRLESLGMLAAGIAHDLNNVFAPIVFIAPLLRRQLSDPRDLKILDTLEQSAGRGAGLVKQILGFAHTSAGELQPTQIKHLVRDILGVIEETFPKSIELEQQIPPDLWLVQGNPTQIHQVVLNLCVNARDAMPQGGRLRIAAAKRRLDAGEARAIPGARPGAWVVLEITDTGTGIPPEVLAHIWEPFFTTKSADKGTGLGLSTVRGIVLSHHGFIELHTETGRGTTFRVFLPALESALDRQKSAAPFALPQGRGELILVVDDEAVFSELVTTILETNGYRVVSCRDGVEAISLFAPRHAEFSLVITDVDMPRLGGVALARALLRIFPDVRIIAMSGLSRTESDASDVPEMQKLAHAFLLKPFKAEALLGAVQQLLHPAGKP